MQRPGCGSYSLLPGITQFHTVHQRFGCTVKFYWTGHSVKHNAELLASLKEAPEIGPQKGS